MHVLAWRILQFDRSRQVPSSLVWASQTSANSKRWLLAGFVRSQEDARWRLDIVHDGPHDPVEFYGHPPTNEEIMRFVEAPLGAYRTPRKGEIVAKAICEREWIEAVGEPSPSTLASPTE